MKKRRALTISFGMVLIGFGLYLLSWAWHYQQGLNNLIELMSKDRDPWLIVLSDELRPLIVEYAVTGILSAVSGFVLMLLPKAKVLVALLFIAVLLPNLSALLATGPSRWHTGLILQFTYTFFFQK